MQDNYRQSMNTNVNKTAESVTRWLSIAVWQSIKFVVRFVNDMLKMFWGK